MKKAIAILLSIILSVSVFGCATGTNPSEAGSVQASSTAEPTEAPAATVAPAAEESGRLKLINDTLIESGFQIIDSELGSGSTAFDVYVVSGYSTDAKHIRVSTNNSTLLDALEGVNLVSGEDASWGYYITTVAGLTADYDGKSEYWNIFEFDAASQQFSRLETAVDATPVQADSVFMFMMDSN